jgi:hypothetical protein
MCHILEQIVKYLMHAATTCCLNGATCQSITVIHIQFYSGTNYQTCKIKISCEYICKELMVNYQERINR